MPGLKNDSARIPYFIPSLKNYQKFSVYDLDNFIF